MTRPILRTHPRRSSSSKAQLESSPPSCKTSTEVSRSELSGIETVFHDHSDVSHLHQNTCFPLQTAKSVKELDRNIFHTATPLLRLPHEEGSKEDLPTFDDPFTLIQKPTLFPQVKVVRCRGRFTILTASLRTHTYRSLVVTSLLSVLRLRLFRKQGLRTCSSVSFMHGLKGVIKP